MYLLSKKIKYGENYRIYGLDGDFIHTECEPDQFAHIDRICNMSDREFIAYMTEEGEIQ